jgi:hypothetical protein
MSRLSREERIARVTSIRDAAVPIIRSKGRWKPVRVRGEQKRVLGYRVGSLSMLLATPFQQFHMERPSIPARIKGDLGRYGAAVLMFQTKRPLGYELDVWGEGGKMLDLHWDDDGNIEIVSLKSGNWEEEILHAVER